MPGVTEHGSGQSEKLKFSVSTEDSNPGRVCGRPAPLPTAAASSTTKLTKLLVVLRTQPWLLTVAPTTEFHENKLRKRHALYRNAARLRDSLCSKVVNMRIGNIVVLLGNKIMYRNFLIWDLQNHS